jgi:GNAT superfamily N-acetyltransferase
MKPTIYHPTLQECTTIANGISEENKKSPHMMPVTPESLYKYSQLQTGYGIYVADILAGFIKIMPLWWDLYEWWSLFVLEKYRGQWLSNKLIQHILDTHNDKALLCVTNVAHVKAACARFGQNETKSTKMQPDILRYIESWQALLTDDHVFWNTKFSKIAKL